MTRNVHRGTIVRSTTVRSGLVLAAGCALLAAGCGGGGGNNNTPDTATSKLDAKSDSQLLGPDLPTTTPDSAQTAPDLAQPEPDLAKDAILIDTTSVFVDSGAGGSVLTDAAGGAGGSGGNVGRDGGLDILGTGGSAGLDGGADAILIIPDSLPSEAGGGGSSPASCGSAIHAWAYPVDRFMTVAWDRDGSLITGNSVYPSRAGIAHPVTFGNKQLTVGGSSNALVTKLDPATGNPIWVLVAGDDADQTTSGTAVTSGNVVAFGSFLGSLDIDPVNGVVPALNNPADTAVGYIMGLNDSDGSGAWSKKVDLGNGAELGAIVGNPGKDYFLICGATTKLPTTLSPTGSLGGGKDVIVAAVKASDGSVMWAKVFGGAKDQTCLAAALDDSGDAYFVGTNAGTLDFGLGTMTFSGSPSENAMWVAKLNGTDGTVLAAKSFGTSGWLMPGPQGLALDAQGNLILAGSLNANAVFGAVTFTPSGTGSQAGSALVAKLDPNTLTPSWARSFAGYGNINAVSVDSAGHLVVGGQYRSSLVSGPGSDTLQSRADSTTDEPFLLKLDGASGETLCGNRYGDPSSVGAQVFGIAVNRAGTGVNQDRLAIGGGYSKIIDFGGQTTVLPDQSSVLVTPEGAFLIEL